MPPEAPVRADPMSGGNRPEEAVRVASDDRHELSLSKSSHQDDLLSHQLAMDRPSPVSSRLLRLLRISGQPDATLLNVAVSRGKSS